MEYLVIEKSQVGEYGDSRQMITLTQFDNDTDVLEYVVRKGLAIASDAKSFNDGPSCALIVRGKIAIARLTFDEPEKEIL